MESSLTRIYLVRHGETEWNRAKIYQGQMDSPLSSLGIKQAQAVASALRDDKIDVVYCSDLGRARHTAHIISAPHGLVAITDERLRERHLGVFQGLKKDEMIAKYADDVHKYRSGDPDHIIPGGESSRQRYERSIACLHDVAAKHSGENILIVTHGGVVRGFLEMVLHLPMNAKRRFSLYNASIARLSLYNGHWMMDSWGETWHLRNLEVQDDY
ncbi:histidine phosphatase family protein [candidate division KSB1 bacterium]|nr:histidine phosphatase family protein [candidate division KSB1 bacterium]RQW02597.1 MAG: histidine phosphatase family protein [candidate division KSB1 bacterium]